MVPPAKYGSTRHVYLLIALLCCIAGAVDTLSYLRLGRTFVANLTGNTVLLGYHVAEHQWAAAAERLGIVLSFFSGVITSRLLQRRIPSDRFSMNPARVSLGIEFCVLCSLAFLSTQGHLRVALLCILAWTMGLQNDSFQKIGPVNLNTTFITGDIQKLATAVASPVTDTFDKDQRRLQISTLLTAWIAYAGGAILGALGSQIFELRALLIPAALVVVVIGLELRGRK
jgi:uncharacterized membrane protein YoaK (UPF0700 family)